MGSGSPFWCSPLASGRKIIIIALIAILSPKKYCTRQSSPMHRQCPHRLHPSTVQKSIVSPTSGNFPDPLGWHFEGKSINIIIFHIHISFLWKNKSMHYQLCQESLLSPSPVHHYPLAFLLIKKHWREPEIIITKSTFAIKVKNSTSALL